jgi:hypothetical protein
MMVKSCRPDGRDGNHQTETSLRRARLASESSLGYASGFPAYENEVWPTRDARLFKRLDLSL